MDISGTARRLVDVPRKSVTMALEAPQNINDLMDQVMQLVRRAGRLLDRADLIVARLEHQLHDLDTLTDTSLQLTERVGQVADFTDAVSREARGTRELAEAQLLRIQYLLDQYQPLLESLAPLSRETVSRLHPAHVRGLLALLDELPGLVDRIKPALDGMSRVGPDLEDMADRMDTVSHVVEGVPGAKALRRRGKAREEEAAAD